MSKVTLLSIDLAKDVFQVAGFTDRMKAVFNRQIKRRDLTRFMAQQPTGEVVMEACYSSHYWGRVFREMGHRVRLLPAQHVKPFVQGNKSDHNDADARRNRNSPFAGLQTDISRSASVTSGFREAIAVW